MDERTVKILLVFLGIFSAFSILEVGIRIFLRQETNLVQKGESIPPIYKPNLNVSIEKEGGGTNQFITNSFGFHDTEWEEEKEKGAIRIANMGDSFTAAVALPHSANFTALLAKKLNEGGSKKFESLNFGMGGQGTKEALETYKHYARKFKPDVAILWFFLGNDFEDNLVYKEAISNEDISFRDFTKEFFKKSELAHFVVNHLAKNPAIANYLHGRFLERVGDDSLGDEDLHLPLTIRLLFTDDKENTKALLKTEKFLKEFRDEAEKNNIKFLVVLIPANFQVEKKVQENLFEQYSQLQNANFDYTRPNTSLSKILKNLGISYIDLTPNFEEACLKECNLYLVPNGHLSEKGHEFVTQTFKEKIKFDIFK